MKEQVSPLSGTGTHVIETKIRRTIVNHFVQRIVMQQSRYFIICNINSYSNSYSNYYSSGSSATTTKIKKTKD